MPKLVRPKLALFLVAGLACALVIWAAYHYLVARKPLDVANLASCSIEELIDGLQDETSEGLGTHSTALAAGFLASDKEPEFHGGVLGSAKPNDSPVMRELVKRGVAALPRLMDHLEDRRASRLVIKLPFEGVGGMWHSDEYESRYSDKDKQPPEVNGGRGEGRRTVDGEYRVPVGDLCYVAIGQIVTGDERGSISAFSLHRNKLSGGDSVAGGSGKNGVGRTYRRAA